MSARVRVTHTYHQSVAFCNHFCMKPVLVGWVVSHGSRFYDFTVSDSVDQESLFCLLTQRARPGLFWTPVCSAELFLLSAALLS